MSFYTYVLCAHTPIYNAKCANMMLEVSLSCWTPMIRSTCSTILLKFRCKARLKKMWAPSLALSLRRGPCQLHIWLRGLDWLCEAGIKVFEHTDWNKQAAAAATATGQGIVGHLLIMGRFWRRQGLCLTTLHCLISSSHLQELMHRHLYC